jgi:hypothetical protein
MEQNDKSILEQIKSIITNNFKTGSAKMYHGSPVWFLSENPILGVSKKKAGVELLFWSGQSFEERDLMPIGKFKAAGKIYRTSGDINEKDIVRWIEKSRKIVWDYKNIRINGGELRLLQNSRNER